MMIGPALVDDALEGVAVALLGADDLGVERRLVGKAAERVDELRSQFLLAFAHVVRRLERGDGGAAGVEVLLRFAQQVRRQHLARRPFALFRGEDHQVFLRDDRRREKDSNKNGNGTHEGLRFVTKENHEITKTRNHEIDKEEVRPPTAKDNVEVV